MTSADRVTRARSMQTPDDAVRLYDSWAADYDHDVFEVMGFIGTDRIADLLAAHAPDRDQPVIDLGCGTGAAGVRLAHHGFGSIDGVDISPAMLDVAAQLGVYRHLFTADLTQPLTIDASLRRQRLGRHLHHRARRCRRDPRARHPVATRSRGCVGHRRTAVAVVPADHGTAGLAHGARRP